MSGGAENAANLERLYETFEHEGVAAAAQMIEQLFDPEVEFNTLQTAGAGGRTYRGLEGMAGFFGELHGELSDVRYETPQFHPVGDDAVVTFTRMIGTAKQTGLTLRQDLSLVYEFAESWVRCVTAHETPAEALEAAERGHADA
jgi:ketosteroid isomerase-like protein